MEHTCPACNGKLVRRTLGGVSLEVCSGCDAALVKRPDVLRLRELAPDSDPLLRRVQPPPPKSAPVSSAEPRACPGCGAAMTTFTYRGGSTVVERCAACDTLLFDTDELGWVLYEWDNGLAMSQDARAVLDGYREKSLVTRLLKLDTLLWVAAFVLTLRVLKATRHVGHWAALVLSLAVGGGFYFRRRRRLTRAKRRLQRRLDEQLDAAHPETAPKKSSEATTCPWCGAVVPPKTTRCISCDSDIF